MCIYELIHFGCGHSVGYAQRFHFRPAAHEICFQRLLTLNRWLCDVDCPRCRLRSRRGFPYVTVPFGLVVRDDSAFKTQDGKWPSDVDKDKDADTKGKGKGKGKGCVGCGTSKTDKDKAKNKDAEVDTDGDSNRNLTPATTEGGDAADTRSGTGTPGDNADIGNGCRGKGDILLSAVEVEGKVETKTEIKTGNGDKLGQENDVPTSDTVQLKAN